VPQPVAGASSSFSLQKAKDGFTSVFEMALPTQRIRAQSKVITAKSETKPKIDPKDISSVDDGLAETIIGKSLANALGVFRGQGLLGRESIKGRNLDASLDKQLKSFSDVKDKKEGKKKEDEEDRVKLEYLDKKGNKLSIKEAYRRMCYKFHGRMPSHKKREKEAKKEEAQSKVRQAYN